MVPEVLGLIPDMRGQGAARKGCKLQNCPQAIHDVHSLLSYFYFVLNPAKDWEIFCMLWSSGRSPLMLMLENSLSQQLHIML